MLPRHILWVDDDELVLEAYARHFERWGYVVATAATADEARAVAAAFRPELILVDRWMPEGDGRALADELRRLLRPSVPIVLMISSDYEDERPGDEVAHRYLPKDLPASRLRQLLAAALGGQRLSLVPRMT